jgi:hypothetical protein
LVEIELGKAQTKKPLDIIFSSRDIKNLLDGPLYLVGPINDNPTNGILIDPTYGENVIMEEFLSLHELYENTYDRPKAWIKKHNGFVCPIMGLINIPLQVGPTKLDFLFSIILALD